MTSVDRTSNQCGEMVGRPLKHPKGYVYVMTPLRVKHMFAGETPAPGDFTVCGEKIWRHWPWSQRARAMGDGTYCRECERIWNES